MIYGTAWKKSNTATLVTKAIQCGFRSIDTAAQPIHYREDLVGEALAALLPEIRSGVFVQTKYSPYQENSSKGVPLPYDPRASISEQVHQSVTKSLENLRVNKLDRVLLHSPLKTVPETIEAWRTLEHEVSRYSSFQSSP